MNPHRERARACGACSSPMRKEKLMVAQTPVTIDLCASCGGVFLDYYEEARGVARTQPPADPEKASESAEVRCPDCRAAMQTFPYEGNGPDVLTCGECMGMHLDVAAQGALQTWKRDVRPPLEEPSFFDRVMDFLSAHSWFE